jgi:hypothetical protein
VISQLRSQIETVQHNLELASRADLPYEAHLHRARLEDLIGIASRHGIDVTGWVDRGLLSPVASVEGESGDGT